MLTRLGRRHVDKMAAASCKANKCVSSCSLTKADRRQWRQLLRRHCSPSRSLFISLLLTPFCCWLTLLAGVGFELQPRCTLHSAPCFARSVLFTKSREMLSLPCLSETRSSDLHNICGIPAESGLAANLIAKKQSESDTKYQNARKLGR